MKSWYTCYTCMENTDWILLLLFIKYITGIFISLLFKKWTSPLGPRYVRGPKDCARVWVPSAYGWAAAKALLQRPSAAPGQCRRRLRQAHHLCPGPPQRARELLLEWHAPGRARVWAARCARGTEVLHLRRGAEAGSGRRLPGRRSAVRRKTRVGEFVRRSGFQT